MAGPADPPVGSSPRGRPRPDIRLFGAVEVSIDGVGPAPDADLMELVLLLALHPEGLTPAEIGAAMWPRVAAATSLREVPRLLAQAQDWLEGAEPALHVDPDRIRLAPTPVFDSDLFRFAVREGGAELALDLLRGPALSGLPRARYAWLAATGLERGLAALVVDACARLAQGRLQDGDPAGARAAAEAGLRVVPLDERLWRERLRAEAAAGDHARVVELGRELGALLRRELAPYDTMQPETRALLAELRRSREAGRPE